MISTSVRASDLRNQVVILAMPSSGTRNPAGTERRGKEQWQPRCRVRAKIDTQGGKEFWAAHAINASLTHEITIRWSPGISPKMRVQFADQVEGTTRLFDIVSVVNPNNQVRWILLLHCREVVGA